MRWVGGLIVVGLVACASPDATPSPAERAVAPVDSSVGVAPVGSALGAGIDSQTAFAAIDAAQARADADSPAPVDSGTPAVVDSGAPAVVDSSTPAAVDSEDPDDVPDALGPRFALELERAPGEPLPWPEDLASRHLSSSLRPVGRSVAAASSATSAPEASVIRVRVSWRIEPDRDYGFDPLSAHTASVVDAFASPPLVAAPERFAFARLRWGDPALAPQGGVCVTPDRALITTLRATSVNASAETGRILLQVLPDPEDPRRLALGLEVHGPGPTGAQVHEFVHLQPGPPGASCRLWVPDLLAGGRQDLGGFEITVELLGLGTLDSIPPLSLPDDPEGPEPPPGPPPTPLDVEPPRRALLEAGSVHPLLADLAWTAPASWVRELVEPLQDPTAADLARAAWGRVTDPDGPAWTRALCDRHAGALALRPARLQALLLETSDPDTWTQAIREANRALLQDSQTEVRVRAARFLGPDVPADYDPYRRRTR
ncbi:MAG: hypothetical protein R3F62_16855 [Planctomycetota bacterium]